MLLAMAESLPGESRVSGVLETIRRCLGDTELVYVADGALAVARPLCFTDSECIGASQPASGEAAGFLH
jgi:hypothetical protein